LHPDNTKTFSIRLEPEMSEKESSSPVQNDGPVTIESSIEHAKRAFALGKMEEAVSFYATALELM
jgi:HAT1-interacting factor 1